MARISRPSFRAAGRQPASSRLASIADHLRTAPEWQDKLRFNDFHTRQEILNGHAVLEPLGDLHIVQIQERLQNDGFLQAKKETVRDAISIVCAEAAYHPLRNWFNSLRGKWNQIDRTSHWLVDCFGCDDTPYVRAIGRMFLIAMVARVMQPGCQADYMLILEGAQGIQKSTACRVLAGNDAFADNLPRLDQDPVRVSMALRGKWLIEVSEMDSFQGAKMETLKAFVTRRVEDFTPKYGRAEAHEPRQCLLIGTMNGRFSYQDLSGARRFWPVEVHEIDVKRLAGMRDQLFAEALVLFEAGEQHWPDDNFQEQHIKPVQEDRREAEAWVEAIDEWLGGNRSGQTSTPVPPLRLKQVWVDGLGGTLDRYTQDVSRRIANALRSLEWEEKRTNRAREWWPGPRP